MSHSLTTERVAAEIRAEMARQKLTTRSLSKQLDWPTANTRRRVSGSQPLTVDDLTDIAAALGVPVADFLTEQAAVA